MCASFFSPKHDILVNGGRSPCADLHTAIHVSCPSPPHTLVHASTRPARTCVLAVWAAVGRRHPPYRSFMMIILVVPSLHR